jgi:hypothetical protein
MFMIGCIHKRIPHCRKCARKCARKCDIHMFLVTERMRVSVKRDLGYHIAVFKNVGVSVVEVRSCIVL